MPAAPAACRLLLGHHRIWSLMTLVKDDEGHVVQKTIEKSECAICAPGSKELKNQFCIEKDPVDSSAGVLQSSANSAFAELIRLGP